MFVLLVDVCDLLVRIIRPGTGASLLYLGLMVEMGYDAVDSSVRWFVIAIVDVGFDRRIGLVAADELTIRRAGRNRRARLGRSLLCLVRGEIGFESVDLAAICSFGSILEVYRLIRKELVRD